MTAVIHMLEQVLIAAEHVSHSMLGMYVTFVTAADMRATRLPSSAEAMMLLASQDAFNLLLLFASTLAHKLHAESGGISWLSAPTGNSSSSRRGSSSSQQQQQHQQLVVPPYHLQLLRELHPPLLELLPKTSRSSVTQSPESDEAFKKEGFIRKMATVTVALRCMLTGASATVGLITGCGSSSGAAGSGESTYDALDLWPPPLQVPKRLVVPLLQVLMQLSLLAPPMVGREFELWRRLELLQQLQPGGIDHPSWSSLEDLQHASAAAAVSGEQHSQHADGASAHSTQPPPLAGLVEAYLHVLGPAVLQAAKHNQQQQEQQQPAGEDEHRTSIVMTSYSHILAALLPAGKILITTKWAPSTWPFKSMHYPRHY